jgi:hypothetical protein
MDDEHACCIITLSVAKHDRARISAGSADHGGCWRRTPGSPASEGAPPS